MRNCRHGMNPPPDDDEELPLHEALEDDDWQETPNAKVSRAGTASAGLPG